jgi:hypothetical protein
MEKPVTPAQHRAMLQLTEALNALAPEGLSTSYRDGCLRIKVGDGKWIVIDYDRIDDEDWPA